MGALNAVHVGPIEIARRVQSQALRIDQCGDRDLKVGPVEISRADEPRPHVFNEWIYKAEVEPVVGRIDDDSGQIRDRGLVD